MEVARKLIARGHEVKVIGDPTVEPIARAAGCGFTPWVQAPHRKNLDPSTDIIGDWKFTNPLQLFAHAIDALICGPAGRFAADTLEELDLNPADMVLSDSILMGPLMAAESRGMPRAALVPNIYLNPAPGIPPIGLGLQPARGPLGHLRDALLAAVSNQLWKRGLPAINSARKGLGLPPVTSIWRQYDLLDSVFVLTSPSFDFKARRLPANVHYVGAQLEDPSWSEPWISPWPGSDTRPLVLVGLSSTFQNQHAVLQNIVSAFEGLEARGLLTVGPAMDPAMLNGAPSNVVIVRTAPHGEVLKQASVCVTHCGHGTTLKALAAGVPLVCIPMGRDQNDTAARVIAQGAGVRLKPAAKPEQIRNAIFTVIRGPQRRAAERLAAAIADESRSLDVAHDIEILAGTGSSSRPARATRTMHATRN
jgi:UDP:flavonoid glycosyltransferase YjiC (YdhE family)